MRILDLKHELWLTRSVLSKLNALRRLPVKSEKVLVKARVRSMKKTKLIYLFAALVIIIFIFSYKSHSTQSADLHGARINLTERPWKLFTYEDHHKKETTEEIGLSVWL